MAVFIVDASAALAWCFEDEATEWSKELLIRVRRGDEIVVPAHWPAEVLNGLLFAARKKRIRPEQPELFWDELTRLPIELEAALDADRSRTVLLLAEKHTLTVYDAAYLELARRRQLPLGTLDAELHNAGRAEGVRLL